MSLISRLLRRLYRVVTTEPHTDSLFNGQPEVLGVTGDLSHVVYREPAGIAGVGEWDDGVVSPLAGAGGGGAQPGADAGFDDSWRSLSADGSRVFFTNSHTIGSEVLATDRQLEVEENPAGPSEDCAVVGDRCMLEVSRSQRLPEDPLGPGSARFRGASVNGSRVFFTDCAKLTKEATAVANEQQTTCYPEAGTGNDLYEYDLETGALTDLTVDKLPARFPWCEGRWVCPMSVKMARMCILSPKAR